jgi:mono/diheme cytochrome c family protein
MMKTVINALLTAAVLAFLVAALAAQTAKSVWDGIYTDAQAARGAAAFDKECGGCHGVEGTGGSMAPALSGVTFAANYDGQSVGDLFERNRTTMPVGKEGGLSAQQVADITAYMLELNKFPAGAIELPAQSMTLKMIKYLAQNPAEKH